MKINQFALSALLLTGAAFAQTSPPATPAASPAPTKVAVINIQAAIVNTKDGQKAAGELKTKFGPKQAELEKKQSDIAALQEQLRKGSNTMSEEAKQNLMRQVDQKGTSLKRDTEDANADVEQEQQKLMGELGGKMIQVIDKYASDNGYALVLDISSQQTPVLFASNTIDITRDIIALYDKSAATLTSTRPGAAPAAPRTGTPGATPAPRTNTPAIPRAPAAAPKK